MTAGATFEEIQSWVDEAMADPIHDPEMLENLIRVMDLFLRTEGPGVAGASSDALDRLTLHPNLPVEQLRALIQRNPVLVAQNPAWPLASLSDPRLEVIRRQVLARWVRRGWAAES